MTDTWTRKADMPTGRVFLDSGVVNRKIYVVGGVLENLGPEILLTVEEYDTGFVFASAGA